MMMMMMNKSFNFNMTGNKNVGWVPTESRGMEWEMRPGGMLVQRRTTDSDQSRIPPPTIRVRVKYASTYHELNISSQATFGELKKMLTGPTGLHHQDQKLFFKDKERDSRAFLDTVGVKDKSKLVLVEDPISQEKRYLEMRKNANMEKAAKSISRISLEVDNLAEQVSALESIISKGGKVAETNVLGLIEQLMNQLFKLDAIMGGGDVKLQRKLLVTRVQKYVETLDMLKIKNSMPSAATMKTRSNGQRLATILEQPQNGHSRVFLQPSRKSTSEVVVTTKWETFDSLPPSSSWTNNSVDHNKNNWELFD